MKERTVPINWVFLSLTKWVVRGWLRSMWQVGWQFWLFFFCINTWLQVLYHLLGKLGKSKISLSVTHPFSPPLQVWIRWWRVMQWRHLSVSRSRKRRKRLRQNCDRKIDRNDRVRFCDEESVSVLLAWRVLCVWSQRIRLEFVDVEFSKRKIKKNKRDLFTWIPRLHSFQHHRYSFRCVTPTHDVIRCQVMRVFSKLPNPPLSPWVVLGSLSAPPNKPSHSEMTESRILPSLQSQTTFEHLLTRERVNKVQVKASQITSWLSTTCPIFRIAYWWKRK